MAKRPLTIGNITAVSALLVILAVIGYPIFSICTHRATPKNAVMRQLKQIGTALMIYADESDGRLPPVYTSMSFQAALEPYTEAANFQPLKGTSTAPTFNYNLAGLNIYTDIVPLGQRKSIDPSQIPMVYALLLDPKLNSPAVICYADSSTKAWSSRKPFDPSVIFGLQFASPPKEPAK